MEVPNPMLENNMLPGQTEPVQVNPINVPGGDSLVPGLHFKEVTPLQGLSPVVVFHVIMGLVFPISLADFLVVLLPALFPGQLFVRLLVAVKAGGDLPILPGVLRFMLLNGLLAPHRMKVGSFAAGLLAARRLVFDTRLFPVSFRDLAVRGSLLRPLAADSLSSPLSSHPARRCLLSPALSSRVSSSLRSGPVSDCLRGPPLSAFLSGMVCSCPPGGFLLSPLSGCRTPSSILLRSTLRCCLLLGCPVRGPGSQGQGAQKHCHHQRQCYCFLKHYLLLSPCDSCFSSRFAVSPQT
jgi:hypothetical protein